MLPHRHCLPLKDPLIHIVAFVFVILEQVSESESYKQGFSSCMTTILERIPAEFQENEDLKGLKDHLEAFLVNLTTEAETMAYPNTMASGPYIQALSGEWYQQQTGHCVMKSPNQSNDMSQNDWKGSLHSAGNNKANFHSPNLLCSVQETPKWFSEWNTQMQMQYIETYGDQNCEQDVSTYDVFQGIKSIYSNYLQDEEAYCASANEPKECQNNSSVSLKVSGGQTVTPQTSARKPTDLTVNAGNNSQMRRLSDNYDNEKLSIETPNNDTALGRSQQTSSPQLWRPW